MTTTEKEILFILSTIEGSGSFEKSGVKNLVLPGLHIEGIGEVSFPINPIMTKAIIAQAIKAPFGKGSETITDTNVRSAWEIDATQLTFKNEDWAGFLDEVIEEVKEGLGIEEQEISASLYKLLIYEEGDFFLPHKDSEKEEGMFATLIISLPSNHTGGELIIRFEGKEETINFSSSASNYKIPYAAFYADCEHEVKPVTSGYRVNLVYNLVQKAGNKIYSPEFSDQVKDLTGLIQSMESSFNDKPKAILLDHQYTPTNFSLGQLKLHDCPRTQALLEAAEEAGYFARLGLLTHYMMGDLEGVGYDDSYYGRRRGRYSYYDEDEEEEETTETEGTMGDIHELYTEIKHWSEDSGPTLGSMYLEETDILKSIELGEGEPIEQEQEGYTGNAGMTIEFWYHYGAVILWPKSKHADLLFHQPITKRLAWLEYYVQHWENTALNSKDYGKKLLLGLKDFDPENKRYDKDDYSPVAAALVKLGDASFLEQNFIALLENVFEQINVTQWDNLFKNFPPAIFNGIFQKVGIKDDVVITKHLLSVLIKLMEAKATNVVTFALHYIQQLPTYLTAVSLQEIRKKTYYGYSLDTTLKDHITAIVKKVLVLSVHQEIDTKWINKTVESLTKTLPRDYANEVLVAILLEREVKNNVLANALYKVVQQDLVNRTKVKPTPPENWSRKMPKAESYYKERLAVLRPFLASPTQQVFDYVKNEGERNAMSSAIESVTIDLRMETIRKGRPYTLRLIKTQAAYELDLKNWAEDVDLLERLTAKL